MQRFHHLQAAQYAASLLSVEKEWWCYGSQRYETDRKCVKKLTSWILTWCQNLHQQEHRQPDIKKSIRSFLEFWVWVNILGKIFGVKNYFFPFQVSIESQVMEIYLSFNCVSFLVVLKSSLNIPANFVRVLNNSASFQQSSFVCCHFVISSYIYHGRDTKMWHFLCF